MTQSNGPEPARNALIHGKTENNTPDTPTATTANQQHNQHIVTYMPKIPILIEINGGILLSRYVKSIKARRSKDQCKNG
ncbi:hypothetical protein LF907_05705 [Bifidobacterium pseudolongum]|uniref:hypothetical protein n=1 Tax=Bifidobacterium pseudolongum TaxID=1694 RepID=UPI001F0FA42D|nr:hypothetical protein [Bifidobacterium pseudolongum]MCH4850100.1 hypothetical protein [Bifidobacterium pseudolongum]